jgi:hypothetical protein
MVKTNSIRFSWAMFCFCALVTAVFAPSTAAQGNKIPVFVSHSGDDSVGQSVAFELKEHLKASQSFRLAESRKLPHIRVDIVSLDENKQDKGVSSAIGYAIVFDSESTPLEGIMLTNGVRRCGRKATAECGRGLLPGIDQQVEWLRDKWPSYYRQLR